MCISNHEKARAGGKEKLTEYYYDWILDIFKINPATFHMYVVGVKISILYFPGPIWYSQ